MASPGARKRVVFGLVVLGLALLGSEGLARLVRSAVSQGPLRYSYPADLYVSHPVRGFALRPNYRGFFVGDLYGHVAIETNADGYRDAPFPPPSSQTLRVAVLGDSVTMGSGVEAEQRFTDLLERSLGPGVRVLNLGVNSYTLGHYLDQVRDDVKRQRADLVVLAFTINDIASKQDSTPTHLARPGAAEAAAGGSSLGASLVRHSALAWLATELYSAGELAWTRDRVARMEKGWLAWQRRVSKLWQSPRARAALDRQLESLRRELERQGRPLLVAVLPDKLALRDPRAFGLPRRELLAALRRHGIETVDLHEAFASQPDLDPLFLLGDPIHLSPAGHALVARALEAPVRARLPQPR